MRERMAAATSMNSTEDLNEIIVEKRIKKLKIKNFKLLKLQITEDKDDSLNACMTMTQDEEEEVEEAMVGNEEDSFETNLKDDDVASEDPDEVESEEDVNGDNIIDDLDLNQDDSLSHKTFKERAMELMKKTQGEFSHLVQRVLSSDDWLFIHRIIRKSKGLKSKFMMRNLNPFLFESQHVISWTCKFCKESVPAPCSNYISHLASHGVGEDEDPLFPCDVCGVYIKKDKYVVHWVPHFMEHECVVCKKTFALNCHMKYHYKVVHEVQEVTCYQCGKLMKNDLAMRRHLRLFHSNRTNWKICDICGKCVKSRCLEPHKLTHSQDRPYKCEVPLCKKCFKTPSTLYQHQKVHATDSKAHKYLCEYCGKRFKHHTSWNLHVVRIHEGEYEHECNICNKKFHKLFELKKHSVKHSEDRPFPCSVCQKHFKTKTHLKEHITIHSAEKSHICPLCGKGIRMKANLYKHLKVHRNRGEYVPPLNGNSTNALLNNYGFSSSINYISSNSNLSTVSQYKHNNNIEKNIPSTPPFTPQDVTIKSTDMSSQDVQRDEDNLDLCLPPNDLTEQEEITNVMDGVELIGNVNCDENGEEIQNEHPHQLIVLDSNNAILSVQETNDHLHGLNIRKHLHKYDDLIISDDGTILTQNHSDLTNISETNDIDVVADNNLANNIISLIAHRQNEGLHIGGGAITHVTIMVNHNLTHTQSD